MQVERMKEDGFCFPFLKIELAIDSHTNKDSKTDRILKAIRKVCEEEGLIEEGQSEDNEEVSFIFWEYQKEKHLDELQNKRNKLNRQITQLKKETLQKPNLN